MDIIQQQRHGVSFYACPSPAWSGTAHGFSTRLGGVSPAPWESLNLGAGRGDNPANVGENFSRFCAAVGADVNALVKNHQVHSARIRPVTRADILPNPVQAGEFQADGLVTNEPGVRGLHSHPALRPGPPVCRRRPCGLAGNRCRNRRPGG